MNEPIQERFSAYHDGEMSAQERAEFQRALREDPFARRDYMVFRRTLEVLHEVPRHEAPADLADRLVARLGPEMARRRARARASGSLWGWLMGRQFELAAALALLLGVIIYSHDPESAPAPRAPAPEAAEVVASVEEAAPVEDDSLTFMLPAHTQIATLDAQLREAGWAVHSSLRDEGLDVTLSSEGRGLDILMRQLNLWTGWSSDGEAVRASVLSRSTIEVRLRVGVTRR